jgi:hypothetical protein
MGASLRTRRSRALLAAAALLLCGGFFFVLHGSGQAQDQAALGFVFPDKHNEYLTGAEISAGQEQTFTSGTGNTSQHRTRHGLTLSQALIAAEQKRGSPITGVGVYELPRDGGQPLYVAEKPDQVFFFVQGGQIHWLLYDKNNKILERGQGLTVSVKGLPGNLLRVRVTQSPDTGVKAGTEVSFTAAASNQLTGEKLTYRWFVDGAAQSAGSGVTFKHTFNKVGSHSVYLDVRGDKGSRGWWMTTSLDVGKKPAPAQGGGGSSGGGGSGGGSGGTTPGGGTGGGGSFTPTPTPPPATSPLPPPSSSPPPSGSGRGPNLDPNASSTTPPLTGNRVEGILVSTTLPAKPGQSRPGQQPQARAQQASNKNDGVDWPLVGGISLTALLVILGAVRERAHIQRLLPHPT